MSRLVRIGWVGSRTVATVVWMRRQGLHRQTPWDAFSAGLSVRPVSQWRSLPTKTMAWSSNKQSLQLPSQPQERLGDVLADVRRVEIRAARMLTDVLSGGYRSTFRGMGVEFSDVREFVEGDDLRSVDWNVTARLGRPFVKRFVEERERTIVFVLDLAPSMLHGLGAWSPRQAAARYCAMLGLVAIDNHDRVGLVARGSDGPRYVVPQSGGGHVLRIVRDSVEMPASQAGGLHDLITTVNARVRRRAVVFVLSDFMTPGYEQALALSSRHHDVVAIRFLARELFDPPRRLLRARGPQAGTAIASEQLCDFANDRFRAAWQSRVATWHEQHAELLGRSRVDGVDVEVPAQPDILELAKPLQTFFGRRQQREVGR